MNTHVYKAIFIMMLSLSAWASSQTTTSSSPPPTTTLAPSTDVVAGEISHFEGSTQAEATTTRDKVGLILGNLLILSLYAFPMSFAETWAFGDPRKAKKQPKQESPELIVAAEKPAKPTRTISDAAPAAKDDWTTLSEYPTRWLQKLPRVKAGLAAGGCLMMAVVALGAVAFVIYYRFSGQPEMVSQVIPRFAYWFPFALLGMVTDIPFQIIYWEDRNLRVLLRLMIWWFPRVIVIAFVINPPFLQDLDPATTALTMLAIDGVLAAFCLGLYTAREQMRMKGIQ